MDGRGQGTEAWPVFLQEKKLEEEQEKLVQKVAAQSDEI